MNKLYRGVEGSVHQLLFVKLYLLQFDLKIVLLRDRQWSGSMLLLLGVISVHSNALRISFSLTTLETRRQNTHFSSLAFLSGFVSPRLLRTHYLTDISDILLTTTQARRRMMVYYLVSI